MAFLTNEKLVIVGAGGMIGSNMVQSVLMLGLTPNICLYDIYEPGVHGVYDEMCHCAFPGANISYTVDPKEAFTGAKYIISSENLKQQQNPSLFFPEAVHRGFLYSSVYVFTSILSH